MRGEKHAPRRARNPRLRGGRARKRSSWPTGSGGIGSAQRVRSTREHWTGPQIRLTPRRPSPSLAGDERSVPAREEGRRRALRPQRAGLRRDLHGRGRVAAPPARPPSLLSRHPLAPRADARGVRRPRRRLRARHRLRLGGVPRGARAARRRAAAGLAHLTELRTTDFLAYPVEVPFDYTLAVGVFDYFRDPGPLLQKMASITRRKAIATFPQLWNPWTAVRRVRYALAVRDCPVHFFSRARVRRLMQSAGFREVRVRALTNIFFAVGVP